MNTDKWEYVKICITALVAFSLVLSSYLYRSKIRIAGLEKDLTLAYTKIQDLKRLEAINNKQRSEIVRLNSEAEKLKKKVEDVEKLTKQVQILTEKTFETSLSYRRDASKYASRGGASLDEVYKKFNSLEKDIDNQKEQLVQVRSHLEILYERKLSVPAGYPVSGYISSGFGWRRGSFHSGVDICVNRGNPVMATANGTVSYAGWKGGYGLTVIIRHNFGFSTLYAHLSKVSVNAGKRVARGDVIGYSGMTGYATGPHLHYEVMVNDKPVDPRNYL